MTTETQELLAAFVQTGSESVFRELVTRYVDLVYSTALRLVEGDTHRAEDVSQMVFMDLARMARGLSANTALGGWLHRHTCFVAKNLMRGERRRQARERRAIEMNALNDPHGSLFAQIAPHLDEAIQELGPDDRDVIVLRFFERRNLKSVGEALGTTENVAQKRVSRAVHELSFILHNRGFKVSSAALAAALAAGAVTAAPAGLALAISAAALGGKITAGTAASANILGLANLKTGLAGGLLIAALATALLLLNNQRSGPSASQLPSNQVPDARAAATSSDLGTVTPNATQSLPDVESLPGGGSLAETDTASDPLRPSSDSSTKLLSDNKAIPPILPPRLFALQPDSRIVIQGESSRQGWKLESSEIRGFLEAGPGFPGQSAKATVARAAISVPVRSLRSKERLQYHHNIEEDAYTAMDGGQHPELKFFLRDLEFKTTVPGTARSEYQCSGDLVVKGMTNGITMTVYTEPSGGGVITMFGQMELKLSSFGIPLQISSIAAGLINLIDDINVQVTWRVVPTGEIKGPLEKQHEKLVPLVLKLPAPGFRNVPTNIAASSRIEPLSPTPRPPMLVPESVRNIAPASKISSSDSFAHPSTLRKLVDGNKEAEDESSVFLRKGSQWVQLDLGAPYEVFAIVVWHGHDAPKIFHDVIVKVTNESDFLEHVTTVFNNDSDDSSAEGIGYDLEYFETYEGKLIDARGQPGRYIRFHSRGSTESALNQYTEIEVYGRKWRPIGIRESEGRSIR